MGGRGHATPKVTMRVQSRTDTKLQECRKIGVAGKMEGADAAKTLKKTH